MKKVLLAFLLTFGLATTASADVILSTSATQADAGTSLDLGLGETGSMYVWVSTEAGQFINGLSLNLTSSDTDVLEATSHLIENPPNRWNGTNGGVLGDLFTNSNSIALFSQGLGTNGLDDFVLHSTINFTATGAGSTSLQLGPGSNGISAGGDITGSVVFGGGTVNVSAVPEPSSAAILCGLGSLAVAIRRRRRHA